MMADETEEIEISFEGTMFHPNYITGWCMNVRPADWDDSMQPIIGRLFAIATALPGLTAGTILDIAYEKRKVSWEDYTLTIHAKGDEEE